MNKVGYTISVSHALSTRVNSFDNAIATLTIYTHVELEQHRCIQISLIIAVISVIIHTCAIKNSLLITPKIMHLKLELMAVFQIM